MHSQTLSFSNPLTKPCAGPDLFCRRKPSHSQTLSPSPAQGRIYFAVANPLILNPSHQAYRRTEFILPSQTLSFSIPLTKPIAGPDFCFHSQTVSFSIPLTKPGAGSNLFCRRKPSRSQSLSPSPAQDRIYFAVANRLILNPSHQARRRAGFILPSQTVSFSNPLNTPGTGPDFKPVRATLTFDSPPARPYTPTWLESKVKETGKCGY